MKDKVADVPNYKLLVTGLVPWVNHNVELSKDIAGINIDTFDEPADVDTKDI